MTDRTVCYGCKELKALIAKPEDKLSTVFFYCEIGKVVVGKYRRKQKAIIHPKPSDGAKCKFVSKGKRGVWKKIKEGIQNFMVNFTKHKSEKKEKQ